MAFSYQKTRQQLIDNINNNRKWSEWSLESKALLSICLKPILQMSEHQKGATQTQWYSIKLNRHLFNQKKPKVPFFIHNFIKKTDLNEPESKVGDNEVLETVEIVLNETGNRPKDRKAIE